MLCPYCKFDESNVLESRDAQEGRATRRRRECIKCGKRFTTYEKVGNLELKVKKKDGRIEDYSREKLEKCFEKACGKLNKEEVSRMADEIEGKLLNWESTEVPSKEIGSLVMEKLKQTDPVAYIRFATVFLDIDSIEGFNKLLSGLKNDYKKD